ncbi:MAG: amidohydrolase family protein [Rhodopila sp.]|nr:amidohydrolase family protein [Rhodopila sp.]
MAHSQGDHGGRDCLAGAIDCDIHPAVPSTRVLLPYLDDYWREHILRRGLERENLETSSYPANAPINCRPDWRLPSGPPGSSLAALQSHLLDRLRPSFAICNVIHGAQVMLSEDLSAALCRAINNWIRAEWLDQDPRLRASIVVPPHSAELAAEEIERCAPDRRFVQVLLLAMTELPLGRRQNWPIYRAAEAHGLPIGIHAGSSFRHPPSALGWPSYYLEDYVSQSQGFAAALNSLVSEGVFVKFPALKVVLIESGVTWLPASLWRLDKTWRGVRSEVPWLEQLPTETVRKHVRLTLQPFDAPPTEKQLQTLLEQLGSDRMLLFSSDYPHWHFDGDDALPAGLPADLVRKICVDNPLETYPRLKETMR